MSRVRIDVTQEDIANGEQTAPWSCPVGQAITRCYGPHGGVVATDVKIKHMVVLLPYEATRFIRDFDNGRPVKPFSFMLELP